MSPRIATPLPAPFEGKAPKTQSGTPDAVAICCSTSSRNRTSMTGPLVSPN